MVHNTLSPHHSGKITYKDGGNDNIKAVIYKHIIVCIHVHGLHIS